jgi:hypothetical protein
MLFWLSKSSVNDLMVVRLTLDLFAARQNNGLMDFILARECELTQRLKDLGFSQWGMNG